MKGIVLAAGNGGRLRPLTFHTPKVLLEMDGRPLIHYSLDALYAADISEIAVVVGYHAEKVSSAIQQCYPGVEFIFNEQYHGGNALSIYAARDFVGSAPFVVTMGDHIISPEAIQSLVSHPELGCILCVDREAWHSSQLNDATRVLVDSLGCIQSIGKSLNNWNAVDTGVFRMTDQVLHAIESLMETNGQSVTISDAVRLIVSNGQPFGTCDVSGMFWGDVDTQEDLLSLGKLLRERHGAHI